MTLPSGTVAFLFTDIEGSTRLWERDPAAMWQALERHNTILDAAIATHAGVHFKTVGDAYQAAFAEAPAAVAAAVAAQRALAAEPWPETGTDGGPLRVRMAIHAGEAVPVAGDYLAPALNRLARLLSAGHGGQVLLSEVVALLVREALPAEVTLRDLGFHRLRDLLEPEHVWQLVVPGLPATFAPLKSLERHPTNLPAQPSVLVGREAELAAIAALLGVPPPADGTPAAAARPATSDTRAVPIVGTAARLVTLTGPGGTGKTRLALQAAADALDRFPDGVFLVDLAALTDANLLVLQIAASLGIHEGGGRGPREALVAFLADKALLLLLDNLEQFRPFDAAARAIADLLADVPALTVLATSRAPLRVRAEREFPVSTLPVPDPDAEPDLDALAQNPAVQLFVQRARAARAAFAFSPENASDVAAICARLDGLPLAIELAAARTRTLTPSELLGRLGERIDLLEAEVGGPDRQRTLRATIDWSYDLLDPAEQAFFRRLSVFAGNVSLDGAEEVTAEPVPLPIDLLDGIEGLLEQSLLRVEEGSDGEPWYRMLATIRAYGWERLAESGEAAAVREAHGRFFTWATRTAPDDWDTPEGGAWADRIEGEYDDLRAALAWAIDDAEGTTGLQLARQLQPYWELRGHLTEGRLWLRRALAAEHGGPSRERAAALDAAGNLARSQGDYVEARTLIEQSLPIWRQVTDRRGEAIALSHLGIVADNQGDLARSGALHDDALAIWREIGDRRGEALALNNLALVRSSQGDVAAAATLLDASLVIKRSFAHPLSLAITLNNLAILAVDRGDLAAATAHLEETLAIDRAAGNKAGIADSLQNLAALAAERGDLAAAARLDGEGLALRRGIENPVDVAYSLESLAATAGKAGRPFGAARLFGAAEALREALAAPFPESERERYESGVAVARAGRDPAAFAAAWAAGRTLTWNAAADEAEGLAAAIGEAEHAPG